MAELEIAEAVRLISLSSQNKISNAFFDTLASPSRDLSVDDLTGLVSGWNSQEAQFQRLLMGEPIFTRPIKHGIQYSQHYHTYPDATALSALIEASAKCGIPKSPADKLANDAKIEAAIKIAVMRYAVKSAVLNGVWQNAALTAVFDYRHALDGEFKKYLINIGISGLYGGTIGGLSSWINHPFFSNGIVLGVIVGSAFNTASLVSTGDWARFGKSLGVNIVGGATAWAGGTAGSTTGLAVGGPIGAVVGGIIGGIAGGFFGRKVAANVPRLGGRTEYEVNTIFKGIKEQLNIAGLEPDPSLSPNEVVTAMLGENNGGGVPFQVRLTGSMVSDVTELRGALLDMRTTSPRVFATFLESLRATTPG